MVQRVVVRDSRVVVINKKTNAVWREIGANLASDVAQAMADGFNRAEAAHPLGLEARVTLSGPRAAGLQSNKELLQR